MKNKITLWKLQKNYNMEIVITHEKLFSFSDELGWSWHKNKNIPNITLQLKVRETKLFGENKDSFEIADGFLLCFFIPNGTLFEGDEY